MTGMPASAAWRTTGTEPVSETGDMTIASTLLPMSVAMNDDSRAASPCEF